MYTNIPQQTTKEKNLKLKNKTKHMIFFPLCECVGGYVHDMNVNMCVFACMGVYLCVQVQVHML